jgi:deoxyribonuclease V
MTPVISHSWDLSPAEAFMLQKKLATSVIRETQLGSVTTVAGIDVGFREGMAHAAVAMLNFPDLKLIDYALATRPITFPYVPGLLSFREGPVVLEALDRLKSRPDLLIFDGQGLAHPRRFGLACHMGLLTNIPSIGCAKSRLVGQYEEPGLKQGDSTPLTDKGEVIGAVVRTRDGTKPVFVSIGHRVDLPTSVRYVLTCCRGFRLPETTRWAHRLAGGQLPLTNS